MLRLQPAIALMVAVVEQHGGTVLRTLGDGVMALFGVPKALEQHAERACLAAVRMQQAVRELEQDAVESNRAALSGVSVASAARAVRLRIGLHTGKVASDPTEAGDRRGGGAHGLAIHLASRVAALAEPGQVLLTEDTRRLLQQPGLATRLLGQRQLKGIVDPVTLHVLRLEVARSVPGFDSPAREGRFVGRDGELAQLTHALGRTRAGQGQVVCVSGEAGAGKSRLCAEFAHVCQGLGARVLWVRAHPLSPAMPLRPARELLIAWLQITADMAPPDVRRHVHAALLKAGWPKAEDAAALFELLGVAQNDTGDAAGQPRSADRLGSQSRLLAIVADLIRAESSEARLLVVEDLHWLDAGSWPVLTTVAQALASTRTLLLANLRRHFALPWPRLPHVTTLTLGSLDDAAVRTIVTEQFGAPMREWRTPDSSWLDSPEGMGDWVERVVQRSHGNPFFARELARHMRRTHARPSAVAADLPDSIDALIGARIDALPNSQRQVLQTCAVLGKDVHMAILARVLRLPPGRLAAALRNLCTAELLVRTGRGDTAEAKLSFAHPLIQEVAYGAVLRSHRQATHARVADVMERRHAHDPRAGEFAALMAYHREHAGHFLAAARHAARAARWAPTGDPTVGIERWRKVLLLLEREQETEETQALSALSSGRIVFLGWRGGVTTQEVAQLIGRALAQASQADARLPQLLHFAHARMLQASGGSADVYVEAVQAALALPDPPGDPGRRALLHVVLSQAYAWAGRLREALAASDVALTQADAVSAFDREFVGYSVSQWAMCIRARTLQRMGRLNDALDCHRQLKAMAAHEPDVVLKSMAENLAMELDCSRGRADGIEGVSRLQVQMSAQHNDYLRITSAYFLAQVALARHQYAHASSLLSEGLTHLRERRVAVDFEADLLALKSEAFAALGHWPAAARVAGEALHLARPRANRVSECRAALVLARAALASDPPRLKEAEAWLACVAGLLKVTGASYLRPMWRALSARRRQWAATTTRP